MFQKNNDRKKILHNHQELQKIKKDIKHYKEHLKLRSEISAIKMMLMNKKGSFDEGFITVMQVAILFVLFFLFLLSIGVVNL